MITFPVPDGFEVPPDSEGEFTVTAKFRDNGDGTLTLLDIDGSPVDGDDEEEEGPTGPEEEKGEGEPAAVAIAIKKKPKFTRENTSPDGMFERMKKAGFGSRVGMMK